MEEDDTGSAKIEGGGGRARARNEGEGGQSARETEEEMNEEMMKRVEVNDPVSICLLANSYHHGSGGLQQDIGQRQWNFTLR